MAIGEVSSAGQHLAEARRSSRFFTRAFQFIQKGASLSPTGAVALLAAVVLWIIGKVVAGKPLYIIAYGTVGLVVVAWITAGRKLPLVGAREAVRPRVREGEKLEIKVRLTAKRTLSTLVLEERLPLVLGQKIQLPVDAVKVGDEVDHEYSITCWRRGVYQIGPMVAVYGDPVGLTVREQEIIPPFELIVHPYYERVSDRPLTRQFEDPPIRPPVSKPWPSGLEFYGMRDFSPGDDLRRIVWKAVARTGRLLVREAEQGITDRITIFLDNNQAGYGKEEYSLAFETAVQAAASLGVRHIREGYQVTVEVNKTRLVHPLRGVAKQIPLLDAFARVQTDRTPLGESLRRVALRVADDATRTTS